MKKPIAAIVGVGRTEFGELWYENPEKIMVTAGLSALESVDKGIKRDEIEACYLGSFLCQLTNKMFPQGYLSRELGLSVPMDVSSNGGSALYNACRAIRSGYADVVFVGGFEKESDRADKMIDDKMLAADIHEFDTGNTMASLNAMKAISYRQKYASSQEESGMFRTALAEIACKNHRHAKSNQKYAQYPFDTTVQRVITSPLVADPLRLFDCAPNESDGAAGIILTNTEIAKRYTDTPVYIVGSGQASDHVSLYSRPTMTESRATQLATQHAFKDAGISIKDIDVAELFDDFTICELIALEDIGFYRKGEAYKGVHQSYEAHKNEKHIPYVSSDMNMTIIVNPGGGLKAGGHPIGATGIRQPADMFFQLRGEAESNQIEEYELETALCQDVAGNESLVTIHILRI